MLRLAEALLVGAILIAAVALMISLQTLLSGVYAADPTAQTILIVAVINAIAGGLATALGAHQNGQGKEHQKHPPKRTGRERTRKDDVERKEPPENPVSPQ